MDRNEFSRTPEYQYNELALRYSPIAAIVSGIVSVLSYPSRQGIVAVLSALALAVVFKVSHRLLLPRVKTPDQLDAIVFFYQIMILIMICIDAFSWDNPNPSVLGCIFVTSGVLFCGNIAFIATLLICGSCWLLSKWLSIGLLQSHDVANVLVIFPIASIIIRQAVSKTHRSLRKARAGEKKTVAQLQAAHQKLKEETQRRRESEAQLLHSKKTESLGVLAAGVAHDFNNSLLAVSALAENIRVISNDDIINGHADNIVSAVGQASGVCRQMLTYAGRTSDELTDIDLNKVLNEVVPLLDATMRHVVTFKLVCEAQGAVVRGNATQLQQVLMNLVNNGAEAIETSGVVEVAISRRGFDSQLTNAPEGTLGAPLVAGEYYQVAVTDSGFGMSEETMGQMFDPYFTTKSTGHGFGLSTVLGIVQAHKATMLVESEVGKGATILLLFPALSTKFSDSRQFRVPRSKAVRAPNRRVMVVDDDEVVRTPMAEMLRLLEWEVVEVASGAEAVRELRNDESFTLLIIDYKMPEMNGLATLRALRASGCETPAILCSGYISESEQAEAEAEFDGCLPKPYRRRDLEERLLAVVGKDD